VIFVAAPPLAPAGAKFALFAWSTLPTEGVGFAMPRGIGSTCLPALLAHGAPQPARTWNNTGRSALGVPSAPSIPAPSIVVNRRAGLGRSAAFFLQGVIADPGSGSAWPASVTNGIRVRVL